MAWNVQTVRQLMWCNPLTEIRSRGTAAQRHQNLRLSHRSRLRSDISRVADLPPPQRASSRSGSPTLPEALVHAATFEPAKAVQNSQCLQRPASTLDFKPPADGQAAHQQGFQVPRCGLMAMALHQQHLAGISRHGFHQGVIQRPRRGHCAECMLWNLGALLHSRGVSSTAADTPHAIRGFGLCAPGHRQEDSPSRCSCESSGSDSLKDVSPSGSPPEGTAKPAPHQKHCHVSLRTASGVASPPGGSKPDCFLWSIHLT